MIWLLALAPVVDGTTNHTSPQAPRQRSLVAQSISDAIHQRCLAASDYSGCIRANGGETSAREKDFNQTGESSNNERCWNTGVCIAQSGRDQLGLKSCWMEVYIQPVR